MINSYVRKIVWGLALGLFAIGTEVQAATVSYDIGWTGPNSYSLTGIFSFDSSAGITVEEGELISFSIEGFLGATPLGSFSGAPFDFNFDSVAGAFSFFQNWNFLGSGIGFASGPEGQALSLNGPLFESYLNGYVLTASIVNEPPAVPIPAALPLFAAGLSAMGFMGWRRKRRAA